MYRGDGLLLIQLECYTLGLTLGEYTNYKGRSVEQSVDVKKPV